MAHEGVLAIGVPRRPDPSPESIKKACDKIRKANSTDDYVHGSVGNRARDVIVPGMIFAIQKELRSGAAAEQVAKVLNIDKRVVDRVIDGSWRYGIGHEFRNRTKDSEFFNMQAGRCSECGAVAWIDMSAKCFNCRPECEDI